MNKVYILPPAEDWIVDRFTKEWNEDNADISVFHPREADVVWLNADWCWKGLHRAGLLTGKKILTTVHHIVPEKFGFLEKADFAERDSITTAYHVYNQHTFDFIRPLTTRPIHLVNYWANQKIWRPTITRAGLRVKYGFPDDVYIVGSFQRDTEGHDLKSPKLEKGPDLLANFIVRLQHNNPNVHVVLAGWRRQYIINRLTANGINFTYIERPAQSVINELYQTLDLYPVTARQEGGPQALIECGLLNIPCVSRHVGIAEQVLPPDAINDDVMKAIPRVPNVDAWKLPMGYQPYRELIESL